MADVPALVLPKLSAVLELELVALAAVAAVVVAYKVTGYEWIMLATAALMLVLLCLLGLGAVRI